MLAAIIYAAVVLIMSLITFAAYGIDKRQAKKNGRRIPEARLHWLALMGGWLGAWAGQQFFRHKTQKLRFRIIFWAIVAMHLALIVAITVASLSSAELVRPAKWHPRQGWLSEPRCGGR